MGELNGGACTEGMLSGLTDSAPCCCDIVWEPASSPDTPIGVWLNGVTVIAPFGAPKAVSDEEPMDWRR